MILSRTIGRTSLALLAPLLVLGVVMLSTQAKMSQYQGQTGIQKHLSKATKMSENRAQKSSAVLKSPAVEGRADDAPGPLALPPSDPVLPNPGFFLLPFQFRPPPVSA